MTIPRTVSALPHTAIYEEPPDDKWGPGPERISCKVSPVPTQPVAELFFFASTNLLAGLRRDSQGLI